jgi:hypothetical protein
MIVRLNDTLEKKKFREKHLPKITLIKSILEPALHELLQDALLQTLRAEIEVYKAFPKNNANPDINTFNPTNHKKCFMGLGFGQRNGGFSDADLRDYRKAIGTIHHPEWGNCTLLEIWGGDHFVRYPKMVKGVFLYCYNKRKTLPKLFFESTPFLKTELTGITQPDEDDKEAQRHQFFIEVNGIKTTQFGGEPYKSWEDVPDSIKEDFEQHWKTINK